ncbi:50S ribosomal protein L2 [Patescibacteria group bacterium]|nr:50S ribosomal protein L2 [Patescibacteria group bacterium]MBU4353159.1 50S ribosomal protein L2 [Patescibacteria group bacterium]MBU4477181.1 50S ribosomal protein L2 [Patescibacteria group bacterium]MCG2699015.1 50S ribosomal protein L2 [Candidatus Parcubacteria bacterium]
MKKYKPTTPSRRGMTGISYRDVLTDGKPKKSLTRGFRRAVGRNSFGRITTRHKGGGVKRLYREVDFKYDKKDIPAIIQSIEYDPNRSGFIALINYADGEKRYILVPGGMQKGDKITVSKNAEIKPGNRMLLKNISVGVFVYNIELKPESGAKLARSAGNYAEVIAHDRGYALIKLPSSEIRKVPDNAWASIGQVSNDEHRLVVLGKAGRARKMGIRPTVRGSAMNPCDHPFGGGEGRQGAGMRRPKNKWGKGVRGVKTRNKKKYSNIFIVSRRKKKK